MKEFILIICLPIFFIACMKDKELPEEKFELNAPSEFGSIDFEVYNFILKNYYADSTLIIIEQKLDFFPAPIIYKSEYSSGDLYDQITEAYPEMEMDAFLNFLECNEIVKYLKNDFQVDNIEVRLLSEEEVDSFYEKDYDMWNYFYKEYPKSCGMLELSQIGFNETKNMAVLEVFQSVGWKGSRAYVYLLENKNENWNVIERFQTKTNF